MKSLLFLALVAAFGITEAADVPIRKRAVDVVILKDGTRLLGATLSHSRRDGIRMILRREWLQKNAARILKSLETEVQEPASESEVTLASLVEEYISGLSKLPDTSIERIGYLEERLIDLRPVAPQQVDEADLIVLTIPAEQVKQHFRQTSGPVGIASVALLNSLESPETRSRAEIIADLRQIPDSQLVRHLPDSVLPPDSKKSEEAVKRQFRTLLIATDRVFGRTARLIYQANQYFSANRSNAGPTQALTARLMMGTMQTQIQQLLNEGGNGQTKRGLSAPPQILPTSAKRIAESENASVVEVSEMQIDLHSASATVRICLYYRTPEEPEFQLVGRVVGAASQADITDEQLERIANDGQVRKITMTFSSMGVGGNNISRAISMGGVVQVAQEKARASLDEFLKATQPQAIQGGSIQRATLVNH